MRILSNLIVTGRVQGDGVLFIPKIDTELGLSGSFLSASVDRLGLFTDVDRIPKIIDSSSYNWPIESGSGGPTPLKCDPTSSVSTPQQLASFYNCIVTASRSSVFSDSSLDGSSNDRATSEYSGSARRNYTTYTPGSSPDSITHSSKITVSGSLVDDFVFNFRASKYDYTNTLEVYLTNCNTYGTLEELQRIANRFKKLFCKCLKNGETLSFFVTTYCRATESRRSSGVIRFTKCFGNCKAEADIVAGMTAPPIIDNATGISNSNSGYDVPWAAGVFKYVITTVTGSESAPSASGALTANTTPYLVLPSAPVTPEIYYSLTGSLSGSFISKVPGLAYYNTATTTLSIYDGSGSWNPISGSGAAGLTRYTQAIGNGSATSFVVTHNKATRDVMVSVRETSAPYEYVFPTITATTTNAVTVDFGVEQIPTSNQYTVIVV